MSSPAPGQTNLGMSPKLGGLLCYVPCCLGFIFSAVVAIVEKQSRFLRFHAFQSLLFHAAGFALGIAFWVVRMGLVVMDLGMIGLLFSLLQLGVSVALLVVSILMMIKANGGEEYQLPVIGEMAKKWAYSA